MNGIQFHSNRRSIGREEMALRILEAMLHCPRDFKLSTDSYAGEAVHRADQLIAALAVKQPPHFPNELRETPNECQTLPKS